MRQPDYFSVGILKLILANERMMLLEDRVLSVSGPIYLDALQLSVDSNMWSIFA